MVFVNDIEVIIVKEIGCDLLIFESKDCSKVRYLFLGGKTSFDWLDENNFVYIGRL